MSIKERLSRVPTPLGGLALGTASLGGAWALVLPEISAELKLAFAAVPALLILKILSKFILHHRLIKEELSHPVLSSVMPTWAMTSMVVAQALLHWFPIFARALWLIAIGFHIVLLAGFIIFRTRDFKFHHMVPSWFVPPVGIIVAAVTSTGMNFPQLTWILFLFGFVCYLIKLPLMMHRLMFHPSISDAALPTFAIMGAPASLSLAGYLSIVPTDPNLTFLVLLTPLALFMTVLVYIALLHLLRLPFSPGYAAFTFPLVISSIALLKVEDYLITCRIESLAILSGNIAFIELIIATLMVFYVTWRYIWHYFGRSVFRPANA
ncbi:hypothetical protein CI610_01614 [invertebrate metagenome]|uniref:Tellurite resistance protein TehA n=1 Tax=invertebrate metagenome TaxID=1711999 RepID=A0A2H9T851_9ZZZZ